MVFGIIAVGLIAFVWWQIRQIQRHKARRNSLHQDGGGFWIWTDFDGETRRSGTHPDEPGGAWYSSSDNGEGGGSDGGGDGGGGD